MPKGITNGALMHETQQESEDRRVLEVLAQLGGARVSDEDLIFDGDKLVLPSKWTAQDAVDYLRDHIEQQEEEYSFSRHYRYRPYDGAHALQAALKTVFGTAGLGQPIYTFFGKQPPELITIPTSVTSTTQVPWGALAAPLFGGTIYTGSRHDPDYGPLFEVTVQTRRKFKAQVEGLFEAIAHELRTGSIYKGQAVNGATEPEFLDLRGVREEQVIYSEEVTTQLNANVWSLIEHSQRMRELGMPLKRAVLFEGDFGTGKTLGAFLTAQKAVENGWTFVYCRPAKDDLDTVLATARLYQPAVVFFEDVDTIAGGGDRDHVSRLLDMFDGIAAKNTELLCILTTNHQERIVKGMVRPGRLDALVHFGGLDTAGIERMVRSIIADEHLAPDLDFEAIGAAMNVGDPDRAFLPAFAKESIDRAVRYAMARTGDIEELSTQDFVDAAMGLQPQLDLMLGADEGKGPDALALALKSEVREAVHGSKIMRGGLDEGDEFAVVAANGGQIK